MRFGRFILGFIVSLLVVLSAGIIFDYFAQFKNWFSGDIRYFMLYPSIAGVGAVLGSFITWLFVAPGSSKKADKAIQRSEPVRTAQAKHGKVTSKREPTADLAGMPSFDFDKAKQDIEKAGQKAKEEHKL